MASHRPSRLEISPSGLFPSCPSILSSILSLIKRQNSFWQVASESSNALYELSDASTLSISSPSQDSLFSDSEEKFFVLLSEDLNQIRVHETFSVFFQIEDMNGIFKFDSPVSVEINLEDAESGETVCCLGNLMTTGTVLFKKLCIGGWREYARIVVRADRDDIRPFVMNIRLIQD